jgi:glycosyltransferase involved in cell wall biosynthesis
MSNRPAHVSVAVLRDSAWLFWRRWLKAARYYDLNTLPDIIDNGIDGYLVPIRSAEAIAERIDILSVDRDHLMAMKLAARAKAESRRWTVYRKRLVEMAREVIAG